MHSIHVQLDDPRCSRETTPERFYAFDIVFER